VKGAILCRLLGRHRWSAPVSETAIFQRIDCERCGYSIDGAKVRSLKASLPADHWMLRRLP
jgi:hypothetical protein